GAAKSAGRARMSPHTWTTRLLELPLDLCGGGAHSRAGRARTSPHTWTTRLLELPLDLCGCGAHSGAGRAGLTWTKSASPGGPHAAPPPRARTGGPARHPRPGTQGARRAGAHARTTARARTTRVESVRDCGVPIRHGTAMGRIMHPPVAIADDRAIEVVT